MTNSEIQWCDDTCNPVMGCDGCELWPKNSAVTKSLVDALIHQYPEVKKPKETFLSIVKGVLRDDGTAELYRYRLDNIHRIESAVAKILPTGAETVSLKGVYESKFKCYAGKMTNMRGVRKGFPASFDVAQTFAGRMAVAAKQQDLTGKERSKKPWLNGCSRLIFVSDMGDALSEEISFEYLKKEIIDVVESELGKRHTWLWLTKRPERMVEFDAWLKAQGIDWPDKLVAMTSVTSQGSAKRIESLRKLRAKVKGLSVEPLWEDVGLDLKDIDWCIVGGESGTLENASTFDLEWARSLRDQCKKSGTSFFLKQLGSNVKNASQPQKYHDKHGGTWEEWPWDLRIREVPESFK